MNIHNITFNYYSKFLCTNLRTIKNKITFIESDLRNKELKGFGCRFTIYVFITNEKIVITYSPKYHLLFEELKNIINEENIIKIIKSHFPNIIIRKLFEYSLNSDIDTKDAKKLDTSDYLAFEQFFLQMYPNSNISDGWLKEYFTQKVNKGYMFGYFVEDKLVCVSDAPDMPYDEGVIQHTGIATLKEYRKQGYAKLTATFATKELIKIGVCPQWETTRNNIASINLAKSIGYKEVADAYILEE